MVQVFQVAPGWSNSDTLPSVTAALQRIQPGQAPVVIRLLPGTYSAATGEQFPLVLPAGVALEAAGQGQVILSGGAQSGAGPSTCLVVENAEISDITVSHPQGWGIYTPGGSPRLQRLLLLQCQGGLWATATAIPVLSECRLENISGSAVRFEQRAKGELRRCQISQCGSGLEVVDEAAPLLVASQVWGNHIGVVVGDRATPVLRQMQIQHNRTVGLQLSQRARPDLGQPQSEGLNVIRHNQSADIAHEGADPLTAAGNDLLPQRLKGPVVLAASQIPGGLLKPLQRSVAPPDSPEPEPAAPAPAPSSGVFTDLAEHWASPFIEVLARLGLIKGFTDGSFRPDVPVTRAQFAALVSSSFPETEMQRSARTFVDVPSTHWAAGAILWAYRAGFVTGYPNDSFRPDNSLKRIEAIVAIANGLGLPPAAPAALVPYRDRAQVPSYAINALGSATQQRLVVNHPDVLTLRPLEAIRRGEAAALIYQALVFQGRAPVIESPYIVQPAAATEIFPDIGNHWAESAILSLVRAGWVSGFSDGYFRPEESMTRAQYASLLVNAFSPAPRRPSVGFADVPAGHWAAAAIEQAYRGEFLSGFPDRTFAPNHPLLRVQIWVSLVNGLRLMPPEAVNTAGLESFSDAEDMSPYERPPVAQALELELVLSADRRLRPNQVATRGDIAAAVYQALVVLERLPVLPALSPHVLRP